jgi:alkylation response protein AidB-like acyl-CoA dehydrogenase
VKVYATEGLIDVCRLLLEVTGPVGAIKDGSPGVLLRGEIEREYRLVTVNTFGGGSNEIQREIVAMMGLGMPSVPR